MRLGIRLVLAVLLILFFRFLFPPLLSLFMPFVLALIVSWLLNPLVRLLQKRLGLPRGLLSVLLVLLAFGAVGGACFALCHSLFTELSSLLENWKLVWDSLQTGVSAVGTWLDGLLAHLPEEVSSFLDEVLERAWAAVSAWVTAAVPLVGNWAGGMAMGIPSFVVGLVVFLLGTYFITADYPHYRFLLTDRMPQGARRFLERIRTTALGAFAGYVRAEVLISVVVFFILLVGFFLLGQPYAVLLALVLAVMDFIPIIGSGTVMVPWAVVDLILGNWSRAFGLMAVWGVVCVFRRVAEPKAVGSQTGLSPILSLISMYVGMELGGVLGMILGPILCLVVLNICRSGIFHGLAADLSLAVRDTAALLSGAPEE